MDESLLRAAEGTPLSTWVLVIGLIGFAFSQLPKITDSGGNALTRWLESKRRAAELRDDADITDLRRQVANLTVSLNGVRAEVRTLHIEIRLRDRILHEHFAWDVLAYQKIIRLGGQIDPAPPLWPVDTTLPDPPPTDGLPTDDPTAQ